jgi:hypothetical protein
VLGLAGFQTSHADAAVITSDTTGTVTAVGFFGVSVQVSLWDCSEGCTRVGLNTSDETGNFLINVQSGGDIDPTATYRVLARDGQCKVWSAPQLGTDTTFDLDWSGCIEQQP